MNNTKTIALCGLLSAAAFVILFASSLIGIGIYAGPILASLCLLPMTQQGKMKEAIMIYAVSAILTLLLLPDRELSLVFLLMGWYPAGLRVIHKVKSKFMQIVIKIGIYTIIVFFLYGVLLAAFGIDFGLSGAFGINMCLYVMGAIVFLLLDRFYERMSLILNKFIKM